MNKLPFIAVFAFALYSLPTAAQPSLKIEEGNVYDWGKVNTLAPILKAEVKITNTGNKDLIIDKPTTSCGCTAAEPQNNTLKPGEATSLKVTMDISGKSGEVSKIVTIPSNDPINPQTTLTVKANVYSPLEVTPKMFVLNQLQTGKKSSVHIAINNASDHAVTIKAGALENTAINLKKSIKIQQGKSIALEAYFIPRKKGTFSASIEILTDDKDMPSFTIKGYCNATQ